MNCDDLASNLTDFLEGELGAQLEEAALEHLAGCERCEVVLAETRSLIEVVKDNARVVPSLGDRQRMRDSFNDALGGSASPTS